MLRKKCAALSLFCALLSPLLLSANTEGDSPETELNEQEHIAVGGRGADPKTKELLRKRRAEERAEWIKQGENPEAPALQKALFQQHNRAARFLPASAQAESLKPLVQTCVSFPVPLHYLNAIADDDLALEIEDGSHWEIAYADSATLRYWRPADILTITPDYSWYSSYDYYIHNKSNGTYVKANLSMGPFSFGPYSNWIVDIDYGGHIYLQNGMIWCVHPKDQHLLRSWAINDHIILGMEDPFWFYYDHVLINVNMDEYVRVRQY